MKSSPLDHIKIASPCPANWDEMLGDKRKRFCTHCQLKVYNLSEMTEREAENFLFEAEGRVCVRLYRRKDGTVITQDCPVGWRAVKQKVSRAASAVFGLIVGFFGGIFSFSLMTFDNSQLHNQEATEKEISDKTETTVILEPGKLTFEPLVYSEPTMGKLMVAPMKNPPQNSSKNKSSKEAPIEFSGGISNKDEIMWLFTERYPK